MTIFDKTIDKKGKTCACTGPCTGYATRSNCPPLIVLAMAALAAAPSQTPAQ